MVSSPATPRAVFRVSPLMVLFALFLSVCAIPVAFGGPYLWLIYLVPLAVVAWTLRTRTVVDAIPPARDMPPPYDMSKQGHPAGGTIR